MKKHLAVMIVLVVAAATLLAAYGLPSLERAYNLSRLQSFLILLVLVCGSAIIAVGSFEYIFILPLREFLGRLKQTWNKNESLKGFNHAELSPELADILDALSVILRESSERIEKLESKGGYTEDYYRLITTISHQLRTPITGLKWALGSMQSELAKGKSIDISIVKSSLEAASRIGDIVEKMLVGVNEGRLGKETFEAVDVERCVNEVISESALSAMERGMKIEVIKTAGLVPLVKGVLVQIRFVLHSLITNAINYGRPGSIITVTLGRDGAYSSIAVHNEGTVIPKEESALIFSQFSRGREAIRINPNGSGLGLYLARKIVVNHGGSISFESSADQGTSFKVLLPLSHKGELEGAIHY